MVAAGRGVASALLGMNPEIIDERDWNQSVHISDTLTVHVLPARHFSGRGIKRNQTLWGSFMFVTPERKVYYSGDSGYGPHFKAIGEQFGGVDLAIMENGQYDQTGSTSICTRQKRRRPRRISMPKRSYRDITGVLCWRNIPNDPLIQLAKASKDKTTGC